MKDIGNFTSQQSSWHHYGVVRKASAQLFRRDAASASCVSIFCCSSRSKSQRRSTQWNNIGSKMGYIFYHTLTHCGSSLYLLCHNLSMSFCKSKLIGKISACAGRFWTSSTCQMSNEMSIKSDKQSCILRERELMLRLISSRMDVLFPRCRNQAHGNYKSESSR